MICNTKVPKPKKLRSRTFATDSQRQLPELAPSLGGTILGWLTLMLVFASCGASIIQAKQNSTSPPPGLTITILDGDEAIPNNKVGTAREPIVQVEDQNHKPVAGAIVMAHLSTHRATGTISSEGRVYGPGQTFSATTDSNGRIALTFTRSEARGKWNIRFNASLKGVRGSQLVTVSATGLAPAVGIPLFAKVLIVSAVGIGTGYSTVTVARAVGGRGVKPVTSQSGVTITIGSGPAVFGPPR